MVTGIDVFDLMPTLEELNAAVPFGSVRMYSIGLKRLLAFEGIGMIDLPSGASIKAEIKYETIWRGLMVGDARADDWPHSWSGQFMVVGRASSTPVFESWSLGLPLTMRLPLGVDGDVRLSGVCAELGQPFRFDYEGIGAPPLLVGRDAR